MLTKRSVKSPAALIGLVAAVIGCTDTPSAVGPELSLSPRSVAEGGLTREGDRLPAGTELARMWAVLDIVERSLEHWDKHAEAYGETEWQRRRAYDKRADLARDIRAFLEARASRGSGSHGYATGFTANTRRNGEFTTTSTIWVDGPDDDFFVVAANTNEGAKYIEMNLNMSAYPNQHWSCGNGTPSTSSCSGTYVPMCPPSGQYINGTSTFLATFAAGFANDSDADGGQCDGGVM